MYVNPQIRKAVFGDEIRVPLDNIRFPPKCIVCTKDSLEKGGALLRFKGEKKQRNFSITLPLCKEHSPKFQKGLRYVKVSMILMGGSIIPFIIGLVLSIVLQNYPASLPFFIAGIVCCVIGYLTLVTASNHLAKNGREQVQIQYLTEIEVALNVKNLDWVAQYKQFIKNAPKH